MSLRFEAERLKLAAEGDHPRSAAGASGGSGQHRQLACAAALAGLPEMTPARLAAMAEVGFVSAWQRVLRRRPPLGGRARPNRKAGPQATPALAEQLAALWAGVAARQDPQAVLERYAAAGVEVALLAAPNYPSRLAGMPGAPVVIFGRGRPAWAQARPSVAMVGTRSASPYGLSVAKEISRDLAAAGVTVVSGLALGIDGSAHQGALDANGTTLAVVACGLDVVYPPRHEQLWEAVAASGGLLSESPLRARPEAWRFPWRNRLIAGLADVVVVVESHRSGGSMSTVEAAARRGVAVMAVPGSIRSPASEGTNALLADGCAPARDAADVLAALGLATASGDAQSYRAERPGIEAAPGGKPDQSFEGAEATVLAALEATPLILEELLRRTSLTPAGALLALERLEAAGLVQAGPGWWARR